MGLLVVSWLDVTSKPGRTLIAIMGMIVAVVAVVLVDAASSLSRQANDSYIQTTWGRNATFRIIPIDQETLDGPNGPSSVAQLEALLSANGLDRVTTNGAVGMSLVVGGSARQVYPEWVSSAFPDVSFVEMAAGQFPDQTASAIVPHVVLSTELASGLGLSPASAIGARIQYVVSTGEIPDLRTQPAYILVVDGVASQLGPTSDPLAMVIVSDDPPPSALAFQTSAWTIHAASADTDLVNDTVARVVDPLTGTPVFEANRIDQRESLAAVLDQQETTGQAISILALAIGALGILGTGMAGVRERSREFGLRRAIGASTRDVFLSAMIQTLLEALFAAAAAISISYVALQFLARQLVLDRLPLPDSLGLPLRSVVIGVVAAVGVALLAGMLPAIRAAQVSVVRALRD